MEACRPSVPYCLLPGYLGMPYYGRWIWSAAPMLVDKKHISLTELLEKIKEVKSRYEKNKTLRTPNAPNRFKVGDRVQVREMPNMFYSRTQNYVRGVTGTIAACTYKDLIPEDEAFNYDGRLEQYYIVRFRQKGSLGGVPIRQRYLADRVPGSLARAR